MSTAAGLAAQRPVVSRATQAVPARRGADPGAEVIDDRGAAAALANDDRGAAAAIAQPLSAEERAAAALTLPAATAERLRHSLWQFHLYRFLASSYLFIPVLYLQSRGLSFTQIGLLSTVYCATVMIFEVPTGALADHFGRRSAMILGSLLMSLGCLVDYWGRSFSAFAVGDGLLALGMTLASGADSAYLFDLLRGAGREHRYRALEGSATAAKLCGAALALVIGGWVGRFDLGLTYALSAAVCLMAATIAVFMDEDGAQTEVRPRAWLWPLVRGALREVVRRPSLRFAIAFSILVFSLLREGMYLYPIYLKQAHFDVGLIGTTLALLTLMGAWSAHRIERIRHALGERRLLWLLPLLLTLTYLAMGSRFAPWGVALLAAQSLVNGVYSPLSKELLNREIADSRQRATVLSVESMARRLIFGVASPLVGVSMDRYSVASGFYLSAVLGLCGLLFLFGLWPRPRREG